MIIFDKKSKSFINKTGNEYCSRCILKNKCSCCSFDTTSKNDLALCPFGFSVFVTNDHVYSGIVTNHSNSKKIEGHYRNMKVKEDYSILTEKDLFEIINNYELSFRVNEEEFNDIKKRYLIYRNTIHSIKNTMRNINVSTNKEDYYEQTECPHYIKNMKDLNDGVDLIRTLLDFHDESLQGDLLANNFVRRIDPYKMITKLTNVLKNDAVFHNVSFTISGNPNNLVKNYSKRIYIMLFIVLENAIKYAVDGSEIHISLADVNHNECRAVIANEAKGLVDEDVKHIFEYGYRGSNAKGKDGSGVGLSILSNILETTNTDHNVSFENKCFSIELLIKSISK